MNIEKITPPPSATTFSLTELSERELTLIRLGLYLFMTSTSEAVAERQVAQKLYDKIAGFQGVIR